MALLYELLLVLAGLFYLPRALWRRRLPHPGWSMRLGCYPAEIATRLASGGAIWIHAVSVGEVMAVRPLVQALQRERPGAPLVISTVTPAGYHVASKLIEGLGSAIYAPLDLRVIVSRALRLIRPSLLILVESELWPNLIGLTRARGVPVVVINGRVSDRAFRRYRLVRPWLGAMMQMVDLFLMQTEADAVRVIAMGAPSDKVRVLGSLKWDASLMIRPDPDRLGSLAKHLGLRGDERLIVAGSTHRGEEQALLEAFESLKARSPGAKLVIAPRHLERVAEVEGLLGQRRQAGGGRVSQLVTQGRPWDVAIVDSLGQLVNYYALASVVFVGGSLIPHGGQNPLEPASLGKPIVFGPFMHNFAEIAEELVKNEAAYQLTGTNQLKSALAKLLEDRSSAEAMGHAARKVTELNAGCTQRTLEAITTIWPPG
ncbi:MAG: 3-deoxy-D-manno-octulosonic acid transferase [Candidatus Omnitrophica bacterium]|nr:3-deoxy-D-manno-octulosonic acid transferase [Candidatus Omnitrophota bacterium]